MWQGYALATFILWGLADLFYKKANGVEEKYSHLKTIIAVGFIMGIQAITTLFISKFDYDWFSIVRYLPVSLCYIVSMGIGYFGLKFIELSISSPVQNSSGAIATILCLSFGMYALSMVEGIGIILIIVGVFLIALVESKSERESVKIKSKKYEVSIIAISMPILYCIFDALGTFLDAIYLEEKMLMTENEALISYELTFFILATFFFTYLKFFKKEKFSLKTQKNNLIAAILETAGQFFYVYAMATNSTISAVVVSSYCVLSLLLSRIILKEKLSKVQYALIFTVFLGIILTV